MHKKLHLFLIFLFLPGLVGGCSLPGANLATVTPTVQTVAAPPSATLTFTPESTQTPTATLPPTVMPTIQPFIGVVKTPTNVRSRPAKGGDRLGGLNYHTQIKVIGRNANALTIWYWIVFPESPTGTGWVTAKAIDLKGEVGLLPVIIFPGDDYSNPIALPPIIHTVVGQPLPLNDPPSGAVRAVVAQDLLVRVGPGVGYLILGILPRGSILTLTGRSDDKGWVQIAYPSGLDGFAWVSADLIEVKDDASNLPRYNNLATPISSNADNGQASPAPQATATVESGLSPSPTSTVPPPTPSPAGPVGTVTTQINVRTGPASSFQSLGLLNPNDVVILTGRTLNGVWYQIEYASGPDGHAWVAAEYIQVNGDVSQLPYFDNEGKPLK
jgi:uncharacterized protein YraI